MIKQKLQHILIIILDAFARLSRFRGAWERDNSGV